ncbi:mannonate dehydratase [Bradyrhizobium sediminis]|uniref:Mannonate dehydratase n=1 Tax=Bradyrhizobium sediminis TaxID=2840469 RepID=A0A975RUB4_9BRAD|nr:mannonate dehydratase [Bradyrhizobium sediminis]QWG19858.1 mannonate dehydratase [Bradyrhizobium sediminis]
MMLQGWRWYGPDDPVSLDDIRQAGATDVVTALHQVPIGEAWTREAVAERKQIIENGQPGRTPLVWSVVESIPVPDDVKRLGGRATRSIEAWIASLEAVAAAGIGIVCYNFMPVVDWCRTDLEWELPNGARALRFDQNRFAAFDLHILQRPGAAADYSPAAQARAQQVYEAMSQADIDYLVMVIASALPGSTTDALSIPQFRDRLEQYSGITSPVLRRHLIEFLARVAPVAEALGVTLTLHPDDPPRSLFGLPRIASTTEDYQALFDAVPSKANGICLCTGSLGVRAENDLPAMAKRFAPRIGFAHLRATKREADGLSFFEADHLDGDVDMIAVLKALLAENRRRTAADQIVFRPDHGHRMLDDLAPSKRTNPGYTAIGRLRGLAELRGAIRAIEHAGRA